MKLFTPDQMNHQDLDRGFIGSFSPSYASPPPPAESSSDLLIILLLIVLLLFESPPKLFVPDTECK